VKCTILVFGEIGPVSRSTERAVFGIFGVAYAVCARQFLLIGLRQQQQQQHDHEPCLHTVLSSGDAYLPS